MYSLRVTIRAHNTHYTVRDAMERHGIVARSVSAAADQCFRPRWSQGLDRAVSGHQNHSSEGKGRAFESRRVRQHF
jgi:hypothetical protein